MDAVDMYRAVEYGRELMQLTAGVRCNANLHDCRILAVNAVLPTLQEGKVNAPTDRTVGKTWKARVIADVAAIVIRPNRNAVRVPRFDLIGDIDLTVFRMPSVFLRKI